MRKIYLVLIIALSGASLAAQDISTYFPLDTITAACAYDNSVRVLRYKSWDMYQTLDGAVDGPIDSSRCITVEYRPTEIPRFQIALDQLDPALPLFLRYRVPDPAPVLAPDALYTTDYQSFLSEYLRYGAECPEGWCSGLNVRVRVPDETGTEVIDYLSVFNELRWEATACFATERFAGMTLEDIYIKLTFAGTDLSGKYIYPTSFFSYQHDFATSELEEVVFPTYAAVDDSTYRAQLEQAARPNMYDFYYIVKNKSSDHPSPNDIWYVEARPEQEDGAKKQLVLEYGEGSELLFQRFTALRGALVPGSDTLRHELILVDHSPDYCPLLIVDLVMGESTRFRAGSGVIPFASNDACLLFRDGGRLEVMPGERLQYGAGGVGMLGLAQGGRIRLEAGSELLIDNHVALITFHNDPDDQAYVDLLPGSRLVFGEHATLRRKQGDHIFLNLVMRGGTADVSALSAEERALIRYLYPDLPADISTQARLAPNPLGGETADLVLPVALPGGLGHFQLVDALGRTVRAGQLTWPEGSDRATLTLGTLAPGWYVLTTRLPQMSVQLRFMRS